MAQNYYRPLPADFLVLEMLPDKGLVGGLRWRGRRAKDLRNDMIEQARQQLDGQDLIDFEATLTTSFLMSRLRAMHVAGHVEGFGGAGVGGTQIWARTPEGVEFLSTKQEVMGL